MNLSPFFIVLSVVVLAIVALLAFLLGRSKKETRLTPLAGIAFGCILAGIFFGANRWFGYGLLGIGVLFAVIDIIR